MQQIIKKALFFLYLAIMFCMAIATVMEKYKGSDFVASNIYGSWWFSCLWAALALAGIIYFIKRKVRRPSTVLLHLSFIVILLGALLTHLFAEQGMIRLRQGETVTSYYVQHGEKEIETKELPFAIELNSFEIIYHAGTSAVADYESGFTITDRDGKQTEGRVSMNKIFTYKTMRLYQASYDTDMFGSVLSVNSDPYGITITYIGYALLFISLVWILFDPKGSYRKLLNNPIVKKGLLVVLLLSGIAAGAHAAPSLPKETAKRFGELYVVYNNRVCPMQTFALDFTKKIYGSCTYNGLTAEQVLMGWIFWGEEWSNEPFIKVKAGPLKETLQLYDYVSLNSFFNKEMGGYILGPYIQEYYQGKQDKFHTQVADIDDKIQLIMELRRGTILKVFPYSKGGKTNWYAPTESLPENMGKENKLYIQNVFSLLYEYVKAGNIGEVDKVLDKMKRYQLDNGGSSLPSFMQEKAERFYNAVPFATILFMVNLAMGFIMMVLSMSHLCRYQTSGNDKPRRRQAVFIASYAIMCLSFAALTLCEILRWVASGTIPMANGYETMLFVAWLVMLLSLIVCRRFHIMLACGFLMSGFFLLVSHISQMDPQIAHIMPVLNSPLLSIHVSIIMMGFALLSLTFISGLTALMVKMFSRQSEEQMKALQLLSRLFLYPAITTLGFGIFIGAIWANISWGRYWNWDPKEVWALITFMVYAVPLHVVSIPKLKNPSNYHVFMVLAFLTILMTYFGVNYFLGGMHSYA